MIVFVKLQTKARNCTKNNTPPWVLFMFFLNSTNGTKLREVSQPKNQKPKKSKSKMLLICLRDQSATIATHQNI